MNKVSLIRIKKFTQPVKIGEGGQILGLLFIICRQFMQNQQHFKKMKLSKLNFTENTISDHEDTGNSPINWSEENSNLL